MLSPNLSLVFFLGLVLIHLSVASYLPLNDNPHEAVGQHLIVDAGGCNSTKIDDLFFIRSQAVTIIDKLKMTVLGISANKLSPQGVSVTAALAESHLTVHTWPEHGVSLIDVFTCGDDLKLTEALPVIVEGFSCNVAMSNWTFLDRGQQLENPSDLYSFILSKSGVSKKLMAKTDTEYQSLEVWDYCPDLEWGLLQDHGNKQNTYINPVNHKGGAEPGQLLTTPYDKEFYIDGVVQSSTSDEEKYHETLVHPGLLVLPNLKRVLIAGGGEGGTLREVLKYKTVEHITMIELDKGVIDLARKHLPSYSNCSDFTTASCFDDPRVSVEHEDITMWLARNFGTEICDRVAVGTCDLKKDMKFDAIILDLIGPESPASKELYTSEFFSRLSSCVLNDRGNLISILGASPESPYPTMSTSLNQLSLIQNISKYFAPSSTFVYDMYIPSFREEYAFVVAMKDRNVAESWFDSVPMVNFALRTKLSRKAYPLAFYDGAVQHGLQHPNSGWEIAFCSIPDNADDCNFLRNFELFEVYPNDPKEAGLVDPEPFLEVRKSNKAGVEGLALYATRDLPKGAIFGYYDAATIVEISFREKAIMEEMADKASSEDITGVSDWLNKFGFDGSLKYQCALASKMTYTNHACDAKDRNARSLRMSDDNRLAVWSPLSQRHRIEFDVLVHVEKDIKEGDMILMNYSDFSECEDDKKELQDWCGGGGGKFENYDLKLR